jgi:hypothetical protein
MRILKFLIGSLLFFVVVGGIGALITREVLLIVGTSGVKSTLSQMQSIYRNRGQFAKQCRIRGGSDLADSISRVQMRFINDHDYVIEVVCAQFALEPIEINRYSLPPFVKKRVGSTGMIWGDESSGMGIEVFGRKQDIFVRDAAIITSGPTAQTLSPDPANNPFGTFPTSSCSSYGYMCCQEETSSGTGQPYSGVNDCPRSCYSSCQARPVILSLNSDVIPDSETRKTSVESGSPVTFYYTASYEGDSSVKVLFDFGDGETQEANNKSGQIVHTFTCARQSCLYTTKITALTATGIRSADTAISQFSITVTQ